MAAKRMFSKSITNSSLFLMMPQSSQNLYFHLGMNADDDGFCEHFTIMRMTESKPDDLKILQAKHFVHVFDDRVLVILDWKENNLIRSDRYTPSKYLEIYKEELKSLNSGIPIVIPTVDSGKDRLGKDRLGKDSEEGERKRFTPPTHEEIADYCNENQYSINIYTFMNFYESKGWMVGKNRMKDWQAAVRGWHARDQSDFKKSNKNVKPDIQSELNRFTKMGKMIDEGKL